jgi:deoxyribose-phosphate aldolase
MTKLKEKGYDINYAPYCDHTVLRAYTTSEKVIEFCEEAKNIKRHQFAFVQFM